MAKFLCFNRTSKEASLIDTTGLEVSVLGLVIGGLEITSLWPGRSQNSTIIHVGLPHVMVKAAGGSVMVLQFSGGTWNVTNMMWAPATGTLTPLGLHKIHNGALEMLVGLVLEDAGASPILRASWSEDPTGTVEFTDSAVLASVGRAGHSVEYGGVVHATTNRGLWYFQPGLASGDGFNTVAPYQGNDANLLSNFTPLGSFARWRDRLWFMVPRTPSPLLYLLDATFDGLTDPAPGPANPWVNKSAANLADPGVVTVADDGSTSALFVNKNNELCFFYSGANGTFLAKTTPTTFPAFEDLTASLLPSEISGIVNAGLHLIEDSRRKTNHSIVFIIKDRSINTTYQVSWDSENQLVIDNIIDAAGTEFIVPSSQRADVAVYMDEQPAIRPGLVTEQFRGNYDIEYTLIDDLSRLCSISPEFTTDGVRWQTASEGETGDGIVDLSSSPAGDAHTFNWNASADLKGERLRDFRIIAKISGP